MNNKLSDYLTLYCYNKVLLWSGTIVYSMFQCWNMYIVHMSL